MIETIVKGIGFGLLLSVAVGPVFFMLINTSLKRGFKAGITAAIGVSISDTIYIALAYAGLSQLFENEFVKEYLAQVGGVIILVFGIITILNKPIINNGDQEIQLKSTIVRQFLKGFLVNAINPSVWVFWIGVVSLASIDYDYSKWHITLFFGSILVTVFSIDVIKVYLANKLRPLLTVRLMKMLYFIVGGALIFLGAKLFMTAY